MTISEIHRWMLITQRGLDGWPVKQDATTTQPQVGDFAGRAPDEQYAAADWQPRQQLFFLIKPVSSGQLPEVF
jgi:hypothetical protein